MSNSNDPIDAERFRLLLKSPRFDKALKRLKGRSAKSKVEPLNGYPENKAELTYKKGDCQISIVHVDKLAPSMNAYYCGYARFPQRMLQSELFTCFVPVHGGISFDQGDTDGSHVYGFDCAHAGDDLLPGAGGQAWGLSRVRTECERLATAITLVSKWEKAFLSCPEGDEWRERRVSIIERCHAELRKKGIVFNLGDNLGAMIEVLFGGL